MSDRRSEPRRNPSRATRMDNLPPLFYKEEFVSLPSNVAQGYTRVTGYSSSHRIIPKECTKEMIGQHIANYLLSRGQWVVWFRHIEKEFIIAKKEAFVAYNIEGAEEGKSRFLGYMSLAEWAFKQGIYQDSLNTVEGKAFLNGVGHNEDDFNKLFETNTSTAKTKKRKRHSAPSLGQGKSSEEGISDSC